jgi:hypothetical protein
MKSTGSKGKVFVSTATLLQLPSPPACNHTIVGDAHLEPLQYSRIRIHCVVQPSVIHTRLCVHQMLEPLFVLVGRANAELVTADVVHLCGEGGSRNRRTRCSTRRAAARTSGGTCTEHSPA